MKKKTEHQAIEIPASDYQPTAAEMNEPIKLDGSQDVTFEQAVQRMLKPVEIREVSASEWRRRRRKAGK